MHACHEILELVPDGSSSQRKRGHGATQLKTDFKTGVYIIFIIAFGF
jgi:hypothetical protein